MTKRTPKSKSTIKAEKVPVATQSAPTPKHQLYPSYLILCQDAIDAKDGTMSLIRLIDRVTANGLPAKFANFTIVGEFMSACSEPCPFRVVLKIIAPDQKNSEIGPFDVVSMPDTPVNRLVLNCQNFALSQEGIYRFELEAKTLDGNLIGFIGRFLEVRTTGILEVTDQTII